MSHDPGDVEALRAALDARAAGLWRLHEGRLILAAFARAPDLAAEVAAGFVEATRSVELEDRGLGIVRAAIEGEVVTSVAADLSTDSGSGQWLRAFGAERSIAVPLRDAGGHVAAVLAAAVVGDGAEVEVTARAFAGARGIP